MFWFVEFVFVGLMFMLVCVRAGFGFVHGGFVCVRFCFVISMFVGLLVVGFLCVWLYVCWWCFCVVPVPGFYVC